MGECEIYKEERHVLGKVRKMDECGMGKFGTLDSGEKTIAVLGDRWPPTAKLEEGKISKNFPSGIWKRRNERPNIGAIRSRNGAPSRKGCVVNGQMTKASSN